MTTTLSITTCKAWTQAPQGLLNLAGLLEQAGIRTSFPVWQECLSENAVLPLCTWDYTETPEAFADWLRTLHASGTRFPNPIGIMLWNLQKRYLADLAGLGANTVPTVFLEPDECLSENFAEKIDSILEKRGWQDAVVKPLVGQSGKSVRRTAPGQPHDPCGLHNGAIVQPFIPEALDGERCLIFLHGKFSHAVWRQTPEGEWRANSRYGTRIVPFTDIPERMIEEAEAVLSSLPEPTLYARVDMLPAADGTFWLNEIELVDPAIYLEYAPETCTANFAEAIKNWLRQPIP